MKIGIVGAGPAGLLLANNLMQQPGYDVHVFERQPDPLASPETPTYPIALQGRGLSAIRDVDPSLEESLINNGKGKFMDSLTFYLGKKPRKMKRPAPAFMIEQGDLKREMLQHLLNCQLSSRSSLCFHFDCEVQDLFLHNRTLLTQTSTQNQELFIFDRIVAADGSRSRVRDFLKRQDPKFDYQQKHVPGGYKNFFLQRQEQQSMDADSIHGWMANGQNFLQVPLHEDYTSGVYAFTDDTDPMKGIKPTEAIEYFQTKIPALASFVSEREAEALVEEPATSMCTVRCNRLTAGDRYEVVLLGDAAHTYSSSLNQGCNAALQDVQVLKRWLQAENQNWTHALVAYNAERMIDADAAHELSDYSLPTTKWLKVQFLVRMLVRKLGTSLKLPASLLPPPLPMDIIHDETLSYSEILEQCQDWVQKVKAASLSKKEQDDTEIETAPNAGKLKQILVR